MTMRLAALAAAALLALPVPALAQAFGTRRDPALVDETAADPVTVEIRRDGRLFWLGRLQPGLSPRGQKMELLAESRRLPLCHGIDTGPQPTAMRALDRIGVEVRPHRPGSQTYFFRFDWRAIVPLARSFEACREPNQRTEELSFEAEVPLPPGERVRIDAASGFEAFLSRPAEAAAGTPWRSAEQPPRPIGADFAVTVRRAGRTLWEGVLHQETSADEARIALEHHVPRRIACRPRGRVPRCLAASTDRTTLRIRANDARLVLVTLNTFRDEPKARVRVAVPGEDGRPTGRTFFVQREERLEVDFDMRVDLAAGGTVTIPAGDYRIEVSRR